MSLETTLRVYLKAISPCGPLLLLFLLHYHGGIIMTASAATAEQKCDKVVFVETREILSYLGNVTFTAPSPFKGKWTAVIKFTSPYTFIGAWGVRVQNFGRKSMAIFQSIEEDNLRKGDMVIFQFRILYGVKAKVPKVHSITWENQAICGPPNLTFQNMQSDGNEEDEESDQNGVYENSDEPPSPSDSDTGAAGDEFQEYIASNNVRLA